jgi:hypothetical protein
MSSDAEQEYFSDGLSEELLNLLANIPELRVSSRTSAFSYRRRPDLVTGLHFPDVLKLSRHIFGYFGAQSAKLAS